MPSFAVMILHANSRLENVSYSDTFAYLVDLKTVGFVTEFDTSRGRFNRIESRQSSPLAVADLDRRRDGDLTSETLFFPMF